MPLNVCVTTQPSFAARSMQSRAWSSIEASRCMCEENLAYTAARIAIFLP